MRFLIISCWLKRVSVDCCRGDCLGFIGAFTLHILVTSQKKWRWCVATQPSPRGCVSAGESPLLIIWLEVFRYNDFGQSKTNLCLCANRLLTFVRAANCLIFSSDAPESIIRSNRLYITSERIMLSPPLLLPGDGGTQFSHRLHTDTFVSDVGDLAKKLVILFL